VIDGVDVEPTVWSSTVELVVVGWSVLVDLIDGVDIEPTVWSSTVELVVVGWSVLVDVIDGVDIEPTVWSSTVELVVVGWSVLVLIIMHIVSIFSENPRIFVLSCNISHSFDFEISVTLI
jgi:hypothetical protein